jgi:amino acid transporter
MDELTSIFYAPGEAFRMIGFNAIIFIALTSIIMRVLSNRMVEISQVLEENRLLGGGVYNFSYLVLGPVISFIAIASIMVDYILTASMSTVSSVENGVAMFGLPPETKFILFFVVVWAIAGLNILGIRENAKVTWGIFVFTAVVFLNFITSGFFEMGGEQYQHIARSTQSVVTQIGSKGFFDGYFLIVANVGCCILAYSGIESVLQTASLVKGWREIKKAYWFLALTVGIVTPVVVAMVMSHASLDFKTHETDLIPYFASLLNGRWFGGLMSAVASITLIMAVNTAFVASSELIERVAHRYGFQWILKTNRYDSLYVIHIANACFYSIIIFITAGKQAMLAEMYALGLVACFVINTGSLLIFRYQKGKTEGKQYTTHRLMTFLLFVFLLSIFIFMVIHKPYGAALWVGATSFALAVGLIVAKRRSPEVKQKRKGDSVMDILLYIASHDNKNVHIYFKRPFDKEKMNFYDASSVYITFFSPRKDIPPKLDENHFRIPVKRYNLFNNIQAIVDMLCFEIPDHNITLRFGWPSSNWIDRLSIGFMTFQIMKLPRKYPNINCKIEHFSKGLLEENTKAS